MNKKLTGVQVNYIKLINKIAFQNSKHAPELMDGYGGMVIGYPTVAVIPALSQT